MLHSLLPKAHAKPWYFPCWAQSLMVSTTGSLLMGIRLAHEEMQSACFRMWTTISGNEESARSPS
jgi:hypothetical protein